MLNIRKVRGIVIVIFFLITSISIPYDFPDFEDASEMLVSESSSDFQEVSKDKIIHEKSYTRGHSRNIQNTEFGGSWVDSFKDSSEVDLQQSDNLNLSDDSARIHIQYFTDPHTVALWHFDEGTGPSVNDETDNENDGTFSGGTSWTTGKYGDGLTFDGSNDEINVPDSPSLSITGSISVSFWIKFSQLPTSGKFYPIVSKIEAGTDSYRFIIRDTGKAGFIIISTTGGVSITGSTTLNDNNWHFVTGTWDKSKIRLYVDGESDATPVAQTGSMVDTPDELRLGYSRVWQGGNPYYWYYKGIMDDVRISNISRSEQEILDIYNNGTPKNARYANLTTKPITLPENMQWDTIMIDKTQPENTFLNITILDASDDQPIPGSPKYTESGELDISYIDSSTYPSIKLYATFEGGKYETPILNYWGVGWNASNVWQDTFFGGQKVVTIEQENIEVIDGKAKFNEPASLISTSITVPAEYHYHTLTINKTEPEDTNLYVSVLEAQNYEIIPGFENLTGSSIDILSININKYSSIRLKATFATTNGGSAILYDWSVNFTKNTAPMIKNIEQVESKVYRTQPIYFDVNISDREEQEHELTLQVEYKSPSDILWGSVYITKINFEENDWRCTFTPPAMVELGYYSFRFTCNDSYQYFDIHIEPDFIEVLNNRPSEPDVIISPQVPTTLDDLVVTAFNATDIDYGQRQIEYWYQWFKDDTYLPMFDNATKIPYDYTSKGEHWRCEARYYDGYDPGWPGEAEVVILNTPPHIIGIINDLEMYEDSPKTMDVGLNAVFADADNDNLTFSATTFQDKIDVQISKINSSVELIPAVDWFGTEYITFYANDTFSPAAEITVEVEVLPRNDLPIISKVGGQSTVEGESILEFIVTQNEWLNISVVVEDIDGDVARRKIQYFLNISVRDNLYFSDYSEELIFNPENEDVGWHYINILVTDNNDTIVKYVSQHINIQVLNENDPPNVEIITPKDKTQFSVTDKLSFGCIASDIDLFVPDSEEKLTFNWYWEQSEQDHGKLGIGQELTNISLEPGEYNITVVVSDSGDEEALDFVNIVIKGIPKEKDTSSEQTSSSVPLWLGFVIVLIIVIIIALIFFTTRKRKRELELAAGRAGQVLQPVEAYRTLPTSPDIVKGALQGSAADAQPQAIQGTSIAVMPAQELPRYEAGVPTTAIRGQPQLPPINTAEPQEPADSGSNLQKPRLTQQEKLKILDEQFLAGELSEETYNILKTKYEITSRQYQPLPQLPPATGIESPIPEITPQPVSTIPTAIIDTQTQQQAQPQTLPHAQSQPQAQPQTLPQPQAQSQPTPEPVSTPSQTSTEQNGNVNNAKKEQNSGGV